MPMRKGDRRDVPAWTWIELAQDAKNENVQGQAGDKFGLIEGGHVEVLGVDQQFGVLVRYTTPDLDRSPRGTSCPDGALIFLSAYALEKWPVVGSVSDARKREANARTDAVKRLIGQ